MGYSPNAIERIYDHVDQHYRSMRRGGVYAFKPGYHSSYQDNERNWSGNYSTIAPADRRGDRDAARAIDITLDDPSEMRLITRRYIDACTPDKNGDYDSRIEATREGIGTLDSQNVMVYNRYASGSGSRSQTGKLPGASDSSHLWHWHGSIFTDYATDEDRMLQLAEVLCGLKPGSLAKTKGGQSNDLGEQKTWTGRRKVQIRAGSKKGGWFFSTSHLNVTKINKARGRVGQFERGVWYIQKFLEELGYGEEYEVEPTGFWNQKTQRAYDHFRRDAGWTGDAAKGSVGVSSLTKLQEMAAKDTQKKIRS